MPRASLGPRRSGREEFSRRRAAISMSRRRGRGGAVVMSHVAGALASTGRRNLPTRGNQPPASTLSGTKNLQVPFHRRSPSMVTEVVDELDDQLMTQTGAALRRRRCARGFPALAQPAVSTVMRRAFRAAAPDALDWVSKSLVDHCPWPTSQLANRIRAAPEGGAERLLGQRLELPELVGRSSRVGGVGDHHSERRIREAPRVTPLSCC